MRVLLTHSYFLRFDPKQWQTMQPYAPLGTMYAAAVLRAQGHEVILHDVMFEETPLSVEPVIKSFKPELFVIYDDGFNYLTKMCLTNMRNAAFEMIQIGKKYGCMVIASSSDATDHYDEYLGQGADFILLGEAEQTLSELVEQLSIKGHDFGSIAGLVYKKNDVTIRTLSRKVQEDLDSIPFPAWDLINIINYREAWMKSNGYFSINMSTTRGCPFKCNWCAKPIYGNRYNARSPQNVVNELKMLHKQYHFDHVWFCDDIFGLKPGWVKEFANLLAAENLIFKFKIQSRADLLLKEEQVIPLAAAGCQTVWMGAESGSQKILDAMDKGITISQIKEATAQLKKHKIQVAFFLQFGYLGETKEDIRSTLKMLDTLIPDEIGISVSYPLPGTKFYDIVSEQLGTKANWTDSDELALMFRNNFTPLFYKNLHRYVHAHFRKVRAVERIKRAVQSPSHINWEAITTLAKVPYYAVQEQWQKRILNHN